MVLIHRKFHDLYGKKDVFEHIAPWEEHGALKNHPDILPRLFDGNFFDVDLAPADREDSCDELKERAFPASTPTHHCNKLILGDGEIHILKSQDSLCTPSEIFLPETTDQYESVVQIHSGSKQLI
jgi:hypothetical protein